MMRGAPSVYCDFVDYDEIAHHAGPARPEALAALEGIDGVLATLEQLAAAAPRPYHLVVLSDHGQSQGATFRQRYGTGLDDLIRRLAPVSELGVVATREDEQRGRAHALRAGLIGAPGLDPPAARKPPAPGEVAPGQPPTSARVAPGDRPGIVVVASGNLGLVYLAREPGRLTMEDLDERFRSCSPVFRAIPGSVG